MNVLTTASWRLPQAWAVPITRILAGAALGQAPPEGRSLRVVRDVEFAKLPDGPPKWEAGLINNTWTGELSTISIVPTGELAKSLEINVRNSAQFSLGGPYKIEAGTTMRLRGAISARPPVQYILYLRRGQECFRVVGSAMDNGSD